jgi:hypothetical protein
LYFKNCFNKMMSKIKIFLLGFLRVCLEVLSAIILLLYERACFYHEFVVHRKRSTSGGSAPNNPLHIHCRVADGSCLTNNITLPSHSARVLTFRQRGFNRVVAYTHKCLTPAASAGNKFYFFSTSGGRRGKDGVCITSEKGDRIIYLPSIENEFEFKCDLTKILLMLRKEKDEFKLDYYLYVHCNDENKELLSLPGSES